MNLASIELEQTGKIVITLFDGRAYELDPKETGLSWGGKGLDARCEFLSMLMSRACWDALVLSNIGTVLKPRYKKSEEAKK
jgi:hypothetical protein